VDSISSVKSSLENGFGIAFLPYMAVKKELYDGKYRVNDVEGLEMEYDIYVVTKNKGGLSPSVKETVDLIREIGNEGFC